MHVEGDSLVVVYDKLLGKAIDGAEQNYYKGHSIHKGTVYEDLNTTIVIENPLSNLIASKTRRFNYRYMVAEMLWNLCNTSQVNVLEKVFPGVSRFVADQPESMRDQATWAYGPYLSVFLPNIIDMLKADQGTRRAVVTIDHPQQPSLIGTPPCLVSVGWLVRDYKLHQFVNMRSNDIWRGFPLDVYQFSTWQLLIAQHLGLSVGSYYHNASSMHLYQSDVEAAIKLYHARDMQSVSSHLPHELALLDILDMFGENVIDAMEGTYTLAKSHTLAGYINTYHNIEPMSDEFAWLKSNGYGVW